MKKFTIHYSLFAILVLSSFFLSSCGDSIEEKVVDLQSEIDSMDERIAEMESKMLEIETDSATENAEGENEDNKDSEEDSQTDDTKENSDAGLTEYAFESCNTLPAYSGETWYAEFKKAFETLYPAKANDQYYPSFAKLTESCYSSIGNVVIVMQPGTNMNAGFHMFKFDIKRGKLNEAYIQAGGQTTFATPINFGRRNGPTINMYASATKDACTEDNTFAYNYVENTLYLRELCKTCQGSQKSCTAY